MAFVSEEAGLTDAAARQQLDTLKNRLAAAEERVKELARANSALRRGAARLAESGDIDSLLHSFLAEAIFASDADVGSAFLLTGRTSTEVVCRSVMTRQGTPIAADWSDEYTAFSAADQNGLFTSILHGPVTAVPLDTDDLRELFPRLHHWHMQMGHRVGWNVPLRIGDRALGFLALAFRTESRSATSVRETLEALALHVALAAEVSTLRDGARELSVARERELAAQEHAADLTRANEALRRSAEQISSDQRLPSILNTFLREAVRALNADGGAVMLRVADEPSAFRTEAAFDDELLTDEEIRADPYLGKFTEFSAKDPNGMHSRLASGEPVTLTVASLAESFPEAYDYHRSRGHSAIWSVPLRLGGEVLGFVAVALRSVHEPKVSQQATIAALAQQLVLALRITRLAEESKASAVVREREVAARERAAELVKANHALRSSVDDLVTQTTTDGILTSLLKQAVDISGASSGAILKRVAGSEFEYVTIYADGAIRMSQEILAAGTNAEMRLASRLDPTGHFATLARGEARSRDIEDRNLASHLPRSTAFHRKAGTKRIYDFPYQVTGQVFGYLGLGFVNEDPPSETVKETIKALATQVGLALEFRRISDQIERAAIVEERNKFARDLHDTLAQGFAAILMQLGAAEQSGDIPETLLPYLNRVECLARTSLAEARSTVSELRTSERVRDILLTRLSELARRLEQAYGSVVQVGVRGVQRAFPFVVEDELYLIAQESLTNALKHAQATEVRVELEFLGEGLRLKVRDNGKGFSPDERCKPDHFGLQTMQERSQRIGASLTIISEPGFGTEILTLWSDLQRNAHEQRD